MKNFTLLSVPVPRFSRVFAGVLLTILSIGAGNARAASTTLISVIPDGSASGDAASAVGIGATAAPIFSPDGRKIAFLSAATNLTGQTNANGTGTDVFVRDLETGITTLISAVPDGSATGNGTSISPVFSPDSRKLAFTSQSTNLTAQTDTNGTGNDLFVRDLAPDGVTTLVSVNTANATANKNSNGVVWSPDTAKSLSPAPLPT